MKTTRRSWIKTIGGLSFGGILFPTRTGLKRNISSSLSRTDIQTGVLVIGGGTAGAIAAIQAARSGAKTIDLIKPYLYSIN